MENPKPWDEQLIEQLSEQLKDAEGVRKNAANVLAKGDLIKVWIVAKLPQEPQKRLFDWMVVDSCDGFCLRGWALGFWSIGLSTGDSEDDMKIPLEADEISWVDQIEIITRAVTPTRKLFGFLKDLMVHIRHLRELERENSRLILALKILSIK